MSQKIIKIGSSLGVTVPKNIARKLGWQAGDEVEIKSDEKNRSVAYVPVGKAKDSDRDKISKLTANFIKKYRKDLEALADK